MIFCIQHYAHSEELRYRDSGVGWEELLPDREGTPIRQYPATGRPLQEEPRTWNHAGQVPTQTSH